MAENHPGSFMFASNLTISRFSNQMNGFDFLFPASVAVAGTAVATGNASASVTEGRNDEDDDWGDFVESSVSISRSGSLPQDPYRIFSDGNSTGSLEAALPDSVPSRVESSHDRCVKPRGPVPLSVFGIPEEEDEEKGDESGPSIPSLAFSFDYTSSKHINGEVSGNEVVNTNPDAGIRDLIASLYRDSGQSKLDNRLNTISDSNEKVNQWSLEAPVNMWSTDFSQKIPNSAVTLDNLSWNPLNFDKERYEPKSDAINSNSSEMISDPNGSNSGLVDQKDDIDEDDGWEFKTAESKSQNEDGNSMTEKEKGEQGSAMASNMSYLSWNFSTLPSNGKGFNVESGEDDDDVGGGDRWEFKVGKAEEPKDDIASKRDGKDAEFPKAIHNAVHEADDLYSLSSQRSDGWGFRVDSSPATKIAAASSSNLNDENIPNFFSSDSVETLWAFKQPSLEASTQNKEKLGFADIVHATFDLHSSEGVIQKEEVLPEKPRGPLPLSIFGEENLEGYNHIAHEDVPPTHDSSPRDKPKSPGPNISIDDLISSLYSQVEKASNDPNETHQENGFGSFVAITDPNLVYEEDDSWEFQGPTISTSESKFTKTVEFNEDSMQIPMEFPIADDLDQFNDDSWEFHGPSQPMTDSDLKQSDLISSEFTEQHEEPAIINIEVEDFRDFFDKLKNELCYIAQNHMENLQKARSLAADSGESIKFERCDEELQDLRKRLHEDDLIRDIDLDSLDSRSSGISEFMKTLEQPKFRAVDVAYCVSERLSLAEKDRNSMIDLLKDAALNLKILNLGSAEQQFSYILTWSTIAAACAQELRHAVSIWDKAREKNIQNEILSKSKGKNYILALGEIHKIAKMLGATIKLYKPWIILAHGSNVGALLEECVSLWSSSGLEAAFLSISNVPGDHQEIDELDAVALHSHIVSASVPTCHISGLTPKMIPGMRTVEWKGNNCFLAIVNLWANLINPDPPSLCQALLMGNSSFSSSLNPPYLSY